MTTSTNVNKHTRPLCQVSDIADPGCLEIEHDGQSLFLVRFQNKVRLYRNRCPHRHVRLNAGPDRFLDNSGNLLQCASHGALFLIETGECVSGPCQGEFLEGLPVHLRGEWVYLC